MSPKSSLTPEEERRQAELLSNVELRPMQDLPFPLRTSSVVSRWTRFCWWSSRKLGGRSIFGKRDES